MSTVHLGQETRELHERKNSHIIVCGYFFLSPTSLKSVLEVLQLIKVVIPMAEILYQVDFTTCDIIHRTDDGYFPLFSHFSQYLTVRLDLLYGPFHILYGYTVDEI